MIAICLERDERSLDTINRINCAENSCGSKRYQRRLFSGGIGSKPRHARQKRSDARPQRGQGKFPKATTELFEQRAEANRPDSIGSAPLHFAMPGRGGVEVVVALLL